jgi:DNA-binding protein HU-beta
LPESARREQVAGASSSKEIVMPPAKKAAATKKAAPAAKVGCPCEEGRRPEVSRRSSQESCSGEAAPQVTITLKQIAAELAESHDLPKKQAEAVLGDLVALTSRHLKNGEKIRLTRLGILHVRARPVRMGRNPASGEAIEIAASRKIAFRRNSRRRFDDDLLVATGQPWRNTASGIARAQSSAM